VLSALVWVPVMLAPGYLGVASLPIEMLNGRQVIGIGAALLIGPLLLTGMAALFMLKRRGGKGGRRRLTYRRGIPD
jgi:membrane protein DedA with SNARE-associated domain